MSDRETTTCLDCGEPMAILSLVGDSPFHQAARRMMRRCSTCRPRKVFRDPTIESAEVLAGKAEIPGALRRWSLRRAIKADPGQTWEDLQAALRAAEDDAQGKVLAITAGNVRAFVGLSQWAEGREFWRHGSIYLWGPTGHGKSVLAAAAVAAIAEAGVQPGYLTASRLDAYLDPRRSWSDCAAGRNRWHVQSTRRVVWFDDLGQGSSRDWQIDAIENLISDAYNAERCLVITSNLSPEQIGTIYGDRVASRLAQMCRGRTWQLRGRDWRAP